MTGPPFDRVAVERWLTEFGPRLRAIVRSRCPREAGIEPEEVEQEVRIRVWQAFQGENAIDHPASYLYRAAMNVIVDLLRRRKARPDRDGQTLDTLAQEAHEDAGPAGAVAGEQFAVALRLAVQSLPERRRQPVQLHLQGFGFAEVAQLLQVSDATARNLIYRGMDELRERLREGGWP